ncbi:MAG TPA: two-component regulator propeller domain-containing protein [Bacteroidales bacterium]|nr:two-component regulator propeller domain-containing protein [Bacteroidales bacterium]
MKRKFAISILLFLAFDLTIYCQNNNFLFRNIAPDEGFTYGSIKTVAEDSKGFIWFGTEHGLYRYNTQDVDLFLNKKSEYGSLPNDFIYNIFKDNAGKLWITTKDGLCYYNDIRQLFIPQRLKDASKKGLNASVIDIIENQSGEYFTLHPNYLCAVNFKDSVFNILPFRLTEKGDFFKNALFDKSNTLWICTNNGFVYKSQKPYRTFKLFCRQRPESIQTLCLDGKTIWLGYEWAGVDHINENGTLIEHYDQRSDDVKTRIPHNRIRKIIKDNKNRIWIGTYDGLAIYSNNQIQTIHKNYYNYLPHNSIHSLFMDSRNSVWIGTWSGGLCFTSNYDNLFLHFNRNSQQNSLSSNVISSFAEEKNGTVLVGTEDGFLNLFDRQRKYFTSYNLNSQSSGTNNIKCLTLDKNNTLWIGTLSNGLWTFDLNSHVFKFQNIFKSGKINVYSIIAVENGLWLGTYGNGLFFYDLKNKTLKNYLSKETDPNTLSSDMIRSLLLDSKGNLWVGTQTGLNFKPKGSEHFTRFFYNNIEGKHISNNEVFAIYEDSFRKIWIGTGGGGVDIYNPNTGKFDNLSLKNGLAGYNVYGILEDYKGNLWFSTEKGLSCYFPKNGTFRNYYKEDGLQGNQFNPGAAFKCKNGEFLFGGPNGFNLFNPRAISTNPFPPKVFITGLSINNIKIDRNDPDNPIKSDLSSMKEIKLNYWRNSLSFSFVTNNFIQPHKNKFRYRLVGYQNKWIDLSNQGTATFTKIPSGKYILEVLGSNNDGLWNKEPTQLKITIRYPFWRSWFAYLVYLAILIVILWLVRKELILRQELSRQLFMERVQRENEENINKLKMHIFTNISHEFRTPLTLILSPLENILVKKHIDEDTYDHLITIQRNANRLRMLINQFIDFRKFELNKVDYLPARMDVIKICYEICKNFEMQAKDNAIDFDMESSFQEYELEVDAVKLDRIVFNLLSNAFKYTSELGFIKISIEETQAPEADPTIYSTAPDLTGPVLAIRVTDNGPGIPSEDVPRIFERFFMGAIGKNQGTGIGLNLCYEYAQLHHGAITVKTELGKGSTFSLLLPRKSKGKVLASDNRLLKIWEKEPRIDMDVPAVASDKNKTNAILIVEDNLDMQKQIRKLLIDEYQIIIASNGQQGYEMASSIYPDLVISDVMMPIMSGFDLCKKLKENLQTSHIPVILLTALSETEMQIDGLETGADAYIVKPFENKLLKAQIKNLLASRKRLQQSFKESEEKWAGDSNLMFQDKKLVERAIQIVESNLLNYNFSVEQLALELGISRSSLHRKLRALTSQSATEFIRFVRMKKALKIMKEGSMNIDEIGFAVGFNSHSYFTLCFKKQFGKTPSEYLAEQKAKG